jgi:TolA-binding protein
VTSEKEKYPQHLREALEECFAQIRLARATELARLRRFLEAETVLSPNGELPGNPEELDLLARIAVHRGQFSQARRLWQAILQQEPTHEPAKAALHRLGSPWLMFSFAKRVGFPVGNAFLACFCVLGLVAIWSGFLLSGLSRTAPSATRTTAITRQKSPPEPGMAKAPTDGSNENDRDTAIAPGNFPTQVTSPAIDQKLSAATRDLKLSLERLREMQVDQARSLGVQIQPVQSSQISLLQNQDNTAESIASLSAETSPDSLMLKMAPGEIAEGQQSADRFLTNKGDSIELPEPALLSRLKLNGLAGTKSRRVALINHRAFVANEESEIKIDGKTIKVRCLEVREDSAVIQIDGTETLKKLFLQRAR